MDVREFMNRFQERCLDGDRLALVPDHHMNP